MTLCVGVFQTERCIVARKGEGAARAWPQLDFWVHTPAKGWSRPFRLEGQSAWRCGRFAPEQIKFQNENAVARTDEDIWSHST